MVAGAVDLAALPASPLPPAPGAPQAASSAARPPVAAAPVTLLKTLRRVRLLLIVCRSFAAPLLPHCCSLLLHDPSSARFCKGPPSALHGGSGGRRAAPA